MLNFTFKKYVSDFDFYIILGIFSCYKGIVLLIRSSVKKCDKALKL